MPLPKRPRRQAATLDVAGDGDAFMIGRKRSRLPDFASEVL